MGWRKLLDERLDAAAAEERRTLALRLFIAAVAVGLIWRTFGFQTAALWFCVYALGETLVLACWRAVTRGGALSTPWRVSFLGGSLVTSAAWSGIAVLCWTTGDEALRLAALGTLIGVMLHAQCFDYRSPVSMAVVGGPPAVLFIALPILLGGFSGPTKPVMAITLILALLYIIASAAANQRNAHALERAQAEAVAASRAKSAFLAMMSHELRTPMNGVLGLAAALKKTDLDPVQAGHVDLLIRSGDGLMSILNDLLDISKIEAGKLEVEQAPFDLHELVQRVGEVWAESARVKGVSLSCSIDPLAPQWVAGDANRVRQIAQNLVANALKFTERGEVRVALSAAAGGVELTVADTGIGISARQQARLFEAFAQADATIGRRFGGTGLGLAICKQLVGLMRGWITVESAPGEGSTFRVFLPLVEAAPGEAPAPELHDGDLTGRRVLVVEDNPTNQVVARTILEAAGAAIVIADDGQEALDRLTAEAFDLVLMDVHMPRMDGVEALRRIRAGEAGDPDIPVIALTADVMAEDRRRLAAAGFDAVQGKPVAPMSLFLAMSDALAAAPPRLRSRA